MDNHDILPYILSLLKYREDYMLVCKNWYNLYLKAMELYGIKITLRCDVEDEDFQQFMETSIFKHCKNLKLYTAEMTYIYVPSQLEKLSIVECKFITKIVYETPSKLKEIIMDGCEGIATIENIPNTIKKISMAKIDRDIFIPKFKNLKVINISYCEEINDISNLVDVEVLCMDGCESVTNLPDFTRIKKLYMRNCINIKKSHCYSTLEELDISYCKGIKQLTGDFSKLKKFEISEKLYIKNKAKLENIECMRIII